MAFLAEAGLLDGRRATTHWGVARNFQRLYPKVDWHPEVLITEDSGLFCSGGVYASVDLSLYLVEKLCGHQIAVECSKALLINMPRFYQAGYSICRFHGRMPTRRSARWRNICRRISASRFRSTNSRNMRA